MFSAKGYKIQDVNGKKRVGIVAKSLADLKYKDATKLAVPGDCRVSLEDGTEVDDERYFKTLPAQTVFVFVRLDETWHGCPSFSQGSIAASLERNESLEFDRTDAGETDSISSDLLTRITTDPAFFVSFSDDNLQDVINFDPEQFATALDKSVAVAKHKQEACQQELDRRTQFKEATQLLKLLDIRAQQNRGAENETLKMRR